MDDKTNASLEQKRKLPVKKRHHHSPKRHAGPKSSHLNSKDNNKDLSVLSGELRDTTPSTCRQRSNSRAYQSGRGDELHCNLSEYNFHHRNILANSKYNLECPVKDKESVLFHSRTRSSVSSTETYPPGYHSRRYSFSSDDSYKTVPKRRSNHPSPGLCGTRGKNIRASTLSTSSSSTSPLLSRGNPIPSLDASPNKSAPEIKKMYLETKINMLEIIQGGLQLKLDIQCLREQFLNLLQTYTYVEDNFLQRPSTPGLIHADTSKSMSAARARVRALYESRRARIQKRRAKFAHEAMCGHSSPVSSKFGPPVPPRKRRPDATVSRIFTATSSDGLSDVTLDEWELRSSSSGDLLDCSKHRHNNSPSSEGVILSTSSPESDIPAGSGANTSSSAVCNSSSSADANTSSSAVANISSGSDGTSAINNTSQEIPLHEKPNQVEKNNNLVNTENHSNSSKCNLVCPTSLEPITEEQERKNRAHSPILNHGQWDDSALDMDVDDNGYMIMAGVDPSIVDFNMGDITKYEGAGEAMQSNVSTLDLSKELPRSSSSFDLSVPSIEHTSVPIYTAKKNKDNEGEYVMLQSPTLDVGDYVTLKVAHPTSMMSFYETNMEPSMLLKSHITSAMWNVTSLDMTDNFGPQNIITQSQLEISTKKASPIKYATSELITKLYTKPSKEKTVDRSLRDISNISHISHSGVQNNILDSSFNEFNTGCPEIYPLNSTMKSAIPPVSEDTDDTLENITDDTLESLTHNNGSFDSCTSYSEPSGILQGPNATKFSFSSSKSMDDSYLIDNLQPDQLHAAKELSNYSHQDFITPKRKLPKKTKLCQEHGVHPTFGGPCIFEDSFDILDSSTEEEDRKAGSLYSKQGQLLANSQQPYNSNYMTETDCDSSYLSECVDDTHLASDFSRQQEQYTYDSKHGRMRVLKRQTGQSDMQHIKSPVGLSESDLHFNVTRKHLSLEATRNSLPDLSTLSVPTSEVGEECDSTLVYQSPEKDFQHIDETNSSGNGRPLSIATATTVTTDDSPESAPGMPAPVNSPNITDSSSSRPTTDNYDYVDVRDFIPKDNFKMPPPRQIPPRRKPGVGSTKSGHISSRPKAMSAYGGSVSTLPDYRNQQQALHGVGSTLYGDTFNTTLLNSDSDSKRAHTCSRHFEISDDTGVKRTIIQHSAVARNLSKDRKKVLAKKLKQFNNNFYNSTGNLQIKTLGHF